MTDPSTETSPKPPQLPVRLDETAQILCPRCKMLLPASETIAEQEIPCQFCKREVSLRIFPRFTKEIPPEEASQVAVGSESTCQFYPELKVDLVCDECGCFMSRKASINWCDKDICMPCLHTLREQKKDTDYRPEIKAWDNRAIALLVFLLPFTLFTCPLALFFLIRYRNESFSWVPRSKFRWWLAMILGIAVSLGWLALIIVWIAMLSREIT